MLSPLHVVVSLGLLTLLGMLFLLPSSRAETVRRRLDLAGAITSLVLALSQLGTPGAGGAQTLLPALLAMVLAALFILVERRSLHPLVPLSIFRIRNVSVANLLTLMTMRIASIIIFILTLYLQGVLGFTPLTTGLAFLPCALGAIAGGKLVIRAIGRAGLRGQPLGWICPIMSASRIWPFVKLWICSIRATWSTCAPI